MIINTIKTEIESACYDRDFNRAEIALGIAFLALDVGETMKDRPEFKELETTTEVASIWVKAIGHRIDNISKLITSLMTQSETDGYPDIATATMFVNEVDELKKSVKLDSIDPDFYQNADLIYRLMKPYVESSMEGEA